MTLLQSIILGIVQGITEFIPISSSGHLVITPFLFRWDIPPNEGFVFNVLVQVATLGAVFVYFWRDIIDITRATIEDLRSKRPFARAESRLGWYIILATIPAGAIGLVLKQQVKDAFDSPILAGLFLFGTAILLLIGEIRGRRRRNLKSLNWVDALVMGFFQILAIFPGISRSGATITGGMLRDLERPTAARFSFLMSIPIMLAAGLIATVDLLTAPNLAEVLPAFLPGFLASGVFGYFAIRWLLAFVVRYPMYLFALYCSVLGVLTLTLAANGY